MLLEELQLAVEELSKEQRAVFVAHELEGRSFKKIAAETGVGVNTEAEITKLLEKDVSKSSIAKIVEVSRTALLHFIRSRNLDPKAKPARSGRQRA